VGIEAQPVSAGLAKRTFAFNGADDRVEIRLGDIRDESSFAGLAPFDLVTGTPPYFPIGDGPQSEQVQRGPCRFEHRGGIEAYCLAAAPRLLPHAHFVACEAYLARHRVEPAAAAAGLSIVYWQDIVPREGKVPLLSIFAMRLSAQAGPRVDAPPLVVRDRRGNRTPEFKALRLRRGMPA
jgi:tRNA1(Val) A37 N6-methylase TrmN6